MPERKKLDLRSRPTAQPPPPAAPTVAPGTMLGPETFRPGQVLDPRYMTPWERQQLAAIGWEEGTPVPGNAADLIAAAQQEATAEGLLPVPPDTPPLTMPVPVDISKLPPAKQRELRAALVQAGRLQKQLQEEGAATAGLNPGIADAVRVANDVARASQKSQGITVVDDRPFRTPAAGATAPKAQPPPRQTGWARPFEPPPAEPPPMEPPLTAAGWHHQSAPAAEPAASLIPPVGELSDTGAVGITHCPHCSWELTRPDPSEPTEDDKRIYLMAALGGPGHRFARETTLLAGAIKVGYRELTGTEADAALTQIADDVRRNRVVGDGEWWQRLMDYRMTQAIEYIEVRDVGRVYEGVAMDEIESDDGNPTVYPALVSYLLSNVLHSESIRRAVGQGFMRFQRLCEKLEANADTASFWEGIGSPH